MEDINYKKKYLDRVEKEEADFRSDVEQRLLAIEREVFPKMPRTVKQLQPWYKDGKLATLLPWIVWVFIIITLVIANITGTKIPGLPV